MKKTLEFQKTMVILGIVISSVVAPGIEDRSIVCDVSYHSHWHMWANMSTTVTLKRIEPTYFLINYNNYSDSFLEFVNNYPTMLIETHGEAVSPSTFGDVGKDKFGKLRSNTDVFTENTKELYIVDESLFRSAAFNIYAKIGIGFKRNETGLYVVPFVRASLFSAGANIRTLDVGLSVYQISFIPEPNHRNNELTILRLLE